MFIIGYVRGSSTPVLGAFHGSDIPYFFGFLSNETDWMASDAVSKSHFSRTRFKCAQTYQFTLLAIVIQTRRPIQ